MVLVDEPSLKTWMHGDADYLFDATKAITLQSRSDIIRLTLLNRYSIIDICRWLLSECLKG